MGWSGRALAPPAIEARKRHDFLRIVIRFGTNALYGRSVDFVNAWGSAAVWVSLDGIKFIASDRNSLDCLIISSICIRACVLDSLMKSEADLRLTSCCAYSRAALMFASVSPNALA